MEIKRISSQVLSIYLDRDDLAELDVSYEDLDILCPHTRTVLRQLLECALAQTGFDPGKGEHLLIEAYPLEEEACLLLFTLQNNGKSLRKERVDAPAPTLLLFSDFQNVLYFVRSMEKALPSALYWYKGNYILTLEGELPPLPQTETAEDPELLLAQLREEKLVLIPEAAMEKLREHFC